MGRSPFEALSGLEYQARMYAGVVLKSGPDIDPVMFSHYCSKFLHYAGKARKLRVRLGVRSL